MSLAVVPFAPFDTMPPRVLADVAQEAAAQHSTAASDGERLLWLSTFDRPGRPAELGVGLEARVRPIHARRAWWMKVHAWAVSTLASRLDACEARS